MSKDAVAPELVPVARPRQFALLIRTAPGMVDAVSSSAAGFATGVFAARTLEPAMLGAYGVFLGGTFMTRRLPASLYYLPARLAALDVPREQRISVLPKTLWLGLLLSVVAGLLAGLSGFPIRQSLAGPEGVALISTAAALACFSALYEHARQTFHLAAQSWNAAKISVVHLVVTGAVLFLGVRGGISPVWLPMGSLAVGHFVSFCHGCLIVHLGASLETDQLQLPPLRDLIGQGVFLLSAHGVAEAGRYLGQILLFLFVAAEAAGYVEAARVAAQPAFVLAVGIGMVWRPRIMELASENQRSEAIVQVRNSALLLGSGTLCYLSISAWPHVLNPFARLTPVAYEMPGLVALRIVSVALIAFITYAFALLLGQRREKALLIASCVSAATQLALVLVLMNPMGAYSLPVAEGLGAIVASVLAVVLFRRGQRRL